MCVFAAFTSTTKSTCTAGAFLVRERGVSPLADASCSAAASLSAQLSLIYGTATKAPHIRRFTSHPRYSVAALLTIPLTSTTKRNEGRILRPFCVSRISVTYAKVRSLILALKRTQSASPHCVWALYFRHYRRSLIFAPRGGRLPPPFACLEFRSRTQKYAPSFSHLKEHNLHPLIAFGRYILGITAAHSFFFCGVTR